MASPVGEIPFLIFPKSTRWQVILVCSFQLEAYISVIRLYLYSALSASDEKIYRNAMYPSIMIHYLSNINHTRLCFLWKWHLYSNSHTLVQILTSNSHCY